jgi:hypothetical protein
MYGKGSQTTFDNAKRKAVFPILIHTGNADDRGFLSNTIDP